jgi:hypothetical protein
MATTLKETLAQLEALGNEKVRAQNSKNGAGDNQFGVRLGHQKRDVSVLRAQLEYRRVERRSDTHGYCDTNHLP